MKAKWFCIDGFFTHVSLINAAARLVKKVPKGTSNYQAAWIVDSDGEEHEELISNDEENEEDDYGAGQWEELEGSDSEDQTDIKSIVSVLCLQRLYYPVHCWLFIFRHCRQQWTLKV